MQDPKSPYVTVLSPTSSSLFSDVELAKPVKLSLEPSRSKISPATCPPKWNDVAREIQVETRQSPGSTASENAGSPIAKQLDPHDRLVFGTIPINETIDIISCPRCKRPILRNAVTTHLESCSREKKTKKIEAGIKDQMNRNKERNEEIALVPAKYKKRKHDDEDGNGTPTPSKKKRSKRDQNESDSPAKREKKKKQKVTIPKPKLPVDVEKQCGVWDPEKRTMCARSLTCKSHSMSAKRAVPGRSQPYDILLAQWQRKNQTKAVAMPKPNVIRDAEDVDSEEAMKLVMDGVAKRFCRPLEQHCLVGVRRKTRGLKLYEGLKGALLGAVQSITGNVVGRGRRHSQATEAA